MLTLGSGYHLEHHLYPRVPSPNYKRLAARLRPVLDGFGVEGYAIGRKFPFDDDRRA
jgi:fatty acid desaturase